MPFKSQAQRRKFYAMEEAGDLPKGTAARWEAETPKGKLPARVKPKKAPSKVVMPVRSTDDLRRVYKKKYSK